MKRIRKPRAALACVVTALVLLTVITFLGLAFNEAAAVTDFTAKNLPPSAAHPFGTDWMGRDMLFRSLAGLSLSVRIGLITASCSALIALLLGCAAAIGKKADAMVSWFTDLIMGIPHLLLLILISFACGRGFFGVTLGIVLTHWMPLSRVIRGEVRQLKQSVYILAARKLGVSGTAIVKNHMLPHLYPQFTAGLVLLFPHAILHEASMTFLGFGLPLDEASIGMILSESMGYLSTGSWWLAVFPGAMLVLTVLLFDLMGSTLKKLIF